MGSIQDPMLFIISLMYQSVLCSQREVKEQMASGEKGKILIIMQIF